MVDLIVRWASPPGSSLPGGTLVQLFGVNHQNIPTGLEPQTDTAEAHHALIIFSPIFIEQEYTVK